jgi:hypothetical protein
MCRTNAARRFLKIRKLRDSMRRKAQVSVLVLLAACSTQSQPATHPLLLKATAHEVPLDIWQLPSRKSDAITARAFSRRVDAVSYRKNRIYFSCLTTAAGCTGYTANIAVRHDTIQVLLNASSDLACTESTVWRVTGEVANTTHKRYVFCK